MVMEQRLWKRGRGSGEGQAEGAGTWGGRGRK